jgi:hypothetical protein
MEAAYTAEIKEFLASEEKTKVYPAYIPDKDRAIIHRICEQLNLYCKSTGMRPNRILKIKKQPADTVKRTFDTGTMRTFCRDFNLPITIHESPYFEYFIDLYDAMYGTKDKVAMLTEAVKEAKEKGYSFVEYCNFIRDSMIKALKETKAYEAFTKQTDLRSKHHSNKYDKIYNPLQCSKEHKYYISIDIKKANFSCLKYFNKDIVLGANTWAEFVGKFTGARYFHEAKLFRQIVFGNLDTKKIAIIEKQIIEKIISALKKSEAKINVRGKLSDDEIIVETTPDTYAQDYKSVMETIGTLERDIHDMLKVEVFRLKTINPTAFIAKEILKDPTQKFEATNITVVFKDIDKNIFAQVFKKYYNLPLHPYDLKTFASDILATFEEPLF